MCAVHSYPLCFRVAHTTGDVVIDLFSIAEPSARLIDRRSAMMIHSLELQYEMRR